MQLTLGGSVLESVLVERSCLPNIIFIQIRLALFLSSRILDLHNFSSLKFINGPKRISIGSEFIALSKALTCDLYKLILKEINLID